MVSDSFEIWCKQNDKINLLTEWIYEKNDLAPSEIDSDSNKKIWWRCNNSHEWEASPNKRKISGCPYCSNRVVWKGYNDLLSCYPELANEWDYEKNYPLSPDEVVFGSSKRVWWVCSKGHQFATSISNRVHQGTGCAVCSGKKMLPGYNDLETKNPPFLVEWDYQNNKDISPNEVPEFSKQIVWWKCKNCGNRWKTSISNRSKGTNCPKCAKKEMIKTRTGGLISISSSFSENNPDLLEEWDYEKNSILGVNPIEIMSGCNSVVWWKCKKCGNEWKASVKNRACGRAGCRICGVQNGVIKRNRSLLEQKGSLGDSDVSILDEWDYERNIDISPYDITAYSTKSVWWICKQCGHRWKSQVGNRQKRGCPNCAKELHTSFPEQAVYYYVKKAFNDAINGDMHAGVELDIYIPSVNSAIEYDGGVWHTDIDKDNKKSLVCHENGIKLFRIREDSCPNACELKNCISFTYKYKDWDALENIIRELVISLGGNIDDIDIERDSISISNLFISKRKNNSLENLFPNIAKEWDEVKNGHIKPNMVLANSNRKYWWICSLGHSYKQSCVSRVSKSSGCPYCSNTIVLSGFNDLQKLNARLAAEWNYNKNDIGPDMVIANSNKKVWWVCKEGHEWKAQINRRMRGSNCPFCSGRNVIRGENDLITMNYSILEEWNYERNINISPNDFKGGSNKVVWWICRNGHEWKASIASRVSGRGCPYCTNRMVLKGYNDFLSSYPQIAEEWDYSKNLEYRPEELTPHSGKRVWWKCKACGCEWKTTIGNRVKGNKCPRCTYKTNADIYSINIKKLEGSFAENHPELLKEWNFDKNNELGIYPEKISPMSDIRVYWKCAKCGNEWQTRVGTRSKGSNCPKCAITRRHDMFIQNSINKVGSLFDLRPECINEWDSSQNMDVNPYKLPANSTKKAWWKCSEGHIWEAPIRKRAQGCNCPTCASIVVGKSHSKKIRNIDTGEVFDSAADAESKLGISRSSICYNLKGKTKSAGGYRWEYI